MPDGRMDNESGFALAVVMSAIALVTVIAFGGFFIAQSTLEDSMRVSRENSAYQAASSALEAEMAVFKRESLTSGQSASGYTFGTWVPTNGGRDRYVVVIRALGNDEYEMVATGASQTTTESVSVRFQSFNLWDMNISGAQNDSNGAFGGSASFNGSSVIKGKLYVAGDLDWSANGAIADGPVFVQGGQFTKSSAASQLGSSEDPIDLYLDTSIQGAGADNNNYGVTKGSAPTIQVPWPGDSGEFALYEANASYILTGDSTLSDIFKSDDGAVEITQTVVSGVDYGKTLMFNNVVDANGDGNITADEMNSGPIIYCSGHLTIGEDILRYMGKGVIVALGGITINGRMVPATYDLGDPRKFEPMDVGMVHEELPVMDNANVLGLVSGNGVTFDGQTSDDWLVAAIWSKGTFTATGTHARFRGSIIAENIVFTSTNIVMVTQPGLGDLIAGTMMPEMNNMNARGDWIRR